MLLHYTMRWPGAVLRLVRYPITPPVHRSLLDMQAVLNSAAAHCRAVRHLLLSKTW